MPLAYLAPQKITAGGWGLLFETHHLWCLEDWNTFPRNPFSSKPVDRSDSRRRWHAFSGNHDNLAAHLENEFP
jgi:hypothetical protein